MASNTKSKAIPEGLKPIMLYDHLPGILAGYPAILFLIFSLLSIPFWKTTVPLTGEDAVPISEEGVASVGNMAITGAESIEQYVGLVDPHVLFWIGLAVMILWYIAFAFNLPKSKFLMVFGLLGTFIGIPVVLEFTGLIKPFSWLGAALGSFTPEMNTGGWFVMALTFGGIWLGNFIYSRTHLRVRIDEDGLTLNQLGGKGERFELVGLKTENEPIDYLELFLAGVGSLSLKTRMNKPIFKMNRVIGLYRTPWFPFFPSKLSKIEAMLNSSSMMIDDRYQDRVDAAEMGDTEGDGDADSEDDNNDIGEETYRQDRHGEGHKSTGDNPGEIS